MRLKKFILLEKRSNQITQKEAIKLINSKCSDSVDAYFDDNIIYRGIKKVQKPFLFVDPKESKELRKSANTTNYYTLINDNSPAWKKYPKRSQSIICTTNKQTSLDYGQSYVVLPFDGAKIGVCPKNDYWFSFKKLNNKYISNIWDLSDFNYILEKMFEKVGIPIDDKSFNSIKKAFKEFDKKYKQDPDLEYLLSHNTSVLNKDYLKTNDLMKYVQKILDPNENGFELKKIGDHLPENREVWTDSKSILIHDSIIDDIMTDVINEI
jgi:hypothetical protein